MQERMCEEFGAREAQCYKEEWKVIQHQLEQVMYAMFHAQRGRSSYNVLGHEVTKVERPSGLT